MLASINVLAIKKKRCIVFKTLYVARKKNVNDIATHVAFVKEMLEGGCGQHVLRACMH